VTVQIIDIATFTTIREGGFAAATRQTLPPTRQFLPASADGDSRCKGLAFPAPAGHNQPSRRDTPV
jgi:hypothetical protein